MKDNIIILGAGVSGLTCALRLLQAGFGAEVWARELPLQTTSSTAPAFWYPYLVQPAEVGLRWGGTSFRVFSALASVPEAGVSLRGMKVIFAAHVADPVWRVVLPTFRRLRVEELPEGYRDGYHFETPVVEMPIYLKYLQGLVEALGGRISVRGLKSVEAAFDVSDVVVNCTGLGARELVNDPELYAVRGRLVRVERRGPDELLFDPEGPRGVAYIIPRSNDCVIGGTNEERIETLEPDPEVSESILERCASFEPWLREARRLGDVVGLRPCRPRVRVELERRPRDKVLVHNYGHGGAGVTLSWGCADEVTALIEGALPSIA